MEISWLDFREEDRKRVLEVLELYRKPGAVDELGVGVIRDYFADKLFPGTSTRHTQAKYFLITPYIFMNLEKELPKNIDECIQKLNNMEMEYTQKILEAEKENAGIYGQDILKSFGGKRWLKVGPKEIYWNSLKKYEIFKYPNLSLYGYLRQLLESKKAKNYNFSKKETLEQELDERENININNYWKIPKENYDDWKKGCSSIKLTKNEAKFLRERIITTQKNTFLAECLKNDERMNEVVNLLNEEQDSKLFENLEGLIMKWELPEVVKKDYYTAKIVSDFIYCAQIRFNCIIDNETWDEEWQKYKKRIPEILNNEYLDLLFELQLDDELETIMNRNRILNKNLRKLREIMSEDLEKENFEDKIDDLIKTWELAKKLEKAKLGTNINSNGNWQGLNKLNYRIRDGKNLITQIWEGLVKC